MKGLTMMYDYRGKIAGIILSAAGIIAMTAEKIGKFSIFPKLSIDQHYLLFFWSALFGLLLMTFSKEKLEDDRTRFVRAKAMQTAFYLLTGIMLSFTLIATLAQKDFQLDVTEFYMLLTLALLMYQFLFNIGLHFDFLWEYEDKGLVDNLKNIGRNKWGILVYLSLSALVCIVLTFII